MGKFVPFPGTVFKSYRQRQRPSPKTSTSTVYMFNQKDDRRNQPFSCRMMNLQTDLDDVVDAISGDVSSKVRGVKGHCSAIVKLLSGHKDLLVSHTTWTEWVSSKYHIVCKCSRPLDSISNATRISRVNSTKLHAVHCRDGSELFYPIGWENNWFWGNVEQSCKPLH